MGKYIDTDLLRKEIERRREANKRQYHSSTGGMSWQRMCGEEDCLVELLAFLDSLLQEQQEVDLEKEIKRYTKSCEGAKNANGHIFELDWNGITAIIDEAARHFYELGKNSK